MLLAITGADGQLGTELCRQLGPSAVPLCWPEFELTEHRAVGERLRALRPEAVVNCAAYTQVDRAESEPERCRAVNTLAVENLARICGDLDCPLVQLSTDYVFGADAQRRTPYTEANGTGPLNVYGHSKREAEHLIVRTCGLYVRPDKDPVRGRNFVDTMLCLGRERPHLRVVHDQLCCPSYVPHVARAILFRRRDGRSARLLTRSQYGVFPQLVFECFPDSFRFVPGVSARNPCFKAGIPKESESCLRLVGFLVLSLPCTTPSTIRRTFTRVMAVRRWRSKSRRFPSWQASCRPEPWGW
jgi:dTDP-4-dehydrorhamnose reductase